MIFLIWIETGFMGNYSSDILFIFQTTGRSQTVDQWLNMSEGLLLCYIQG